MPLLVIEARPDDLEGLRAFAGRCSPETLHRRFHGVGSRTVERELRRVAVPTPNYRSWVAVDDGGNLRGTATLARSRSGAAEAALLVEDAWFRRGAGRALVAELGAHARRRGLDPIVARVQADNERALRFLRAVVPGARIRFDGAGELEVRVLVGHEARTREAA